MFGHPSLRLHITEVCDNGITRLRATIIPAPLWAQGQHTDLLIPCGVCFSPPFQGFEVPCWQWWLLSLLALCSPGIPLAGPTEQAAGTASCLPHSAGSTACGRRVTSLNKPMKRNCPVTLHPQMSRMEKKKKTEDFFMKSAPLWGWLSGYLQINHAVQSLLQEVVETSCFCLLSLTDFIKNILL